MIYPILCIIITCFYLGLIYLQWDPGKLENVETKIDRLKKEIIALEFKNMQDYAEYRTQCIKKENG